MKVLRVVEHEDGSWWIRGGWSLANGPYRRPGQLLAVASDLLLDVTEWRIEVVDRRGGPLACYSSETIDAAALSHADPANRWHEVPPRGGRRPPADDHLARA
ncbi:MAG: hypothetical protein U1F35_02615 [Steroidobacteraceae bacterium]